MKQFTQGPQFLTLERTELSLGSYRDEAAEFASWKGFPDQSGLVTGIVLADTTAATRVVALLNRGTMILRQNVPPSGDYWKSNGIAPSALAQLPCSFEAVPGCAIEVRLRGPCSSGYLVVLPPPSRDDDHEHRHPLEPPPPRRGARTGFVILGEW